MDTKCISILEIPEIEVASIYDKVPMTSNTDQPLAPCNSRSVEVLMDVNENKSDSLSDDASNMDFEFVSSDLDHGADFTIDNSSVFGLAESVIVGTNECDDLFRDSPCFNGPASSRPVNCPGNDVALLSEAKNSKLLQNIGLSLQIIPLNNLHYITTVQTNKGLHILAVPGGTSVNSLDTNLVQSLCGPNALYNCTREVNGHRDSIIPKQFLEGAQSFEHYNIPYNVTVSKIAAENQVDCQSFTPIKEQVVFTSSQCSEITSVKNMCKPVISPNIVKPKASILPDSNIEAEHKNYFLNSAVDSPLNKMVSLLNPDQINHLSKVIKPFQRKSVKLTIPVKGLKSHTPSSSALDMKTCIHVKEKKSTQEVSHCEPTKQVPSTTEDAKGIGKQPTNTCTELAEQSFVADDIATTKGVSFMDLSFQGKEITSTDSNLTSKFKCMKCPAVFTRKGNLKNHIKVHNNDTPKTVPLNRDLDLLKGHTNSEMNPNNTEYQVSVDKAVNWASSNFDEADNSFDNIVNIEDASHISTSENHSSVPLAKDKQLCTNSSAKGDVAIGDEVSANNVCHICNVSFKTKGNFTRHQLIHSQSGSSVRFTCTFCNKGFLQRCDLKRHKLTHIDGHPHRCQTCKKGFLRRSDLVLHEQYHLGLRSHSCPMCSKSYIKQGDLCRHIRRSHTSVCQHLCTSCNIGFPSQRSLYAHTRKSHSHTSGEHLQ